MMHDIVVEEFELHLSGSASQRFYEHLAGCTECRDEVAAIENVSGLVRELRIPAEDTVAVPLGFAYRVTAQIAGRQERQAWGLFSLGNTFFRRLAFASLMLLAGLGSYLVTRESSFGGEDAASIIAQHDTADPHDQGSDRNQMLVTLATYRQ